MPVGYIKESVNILQQTKLRDSISEKFIYIIAFLSAIVIVFIYAFIISKSWKVLQVNSLGFVTVNDFDNQIFYAFKAGAEAPVWKFGVLGLIADTILVTVGALAVSILVSTGTAIVITELAHTRIRTLLNDLIRFLASIPSIIYGLIGLLVIVPFIQKHLVTLEMQIEYIKYFQITGKSYLAGVIVLSLMIIPIITSLSVDALNAVPFMYKETAYALGMTKWRMIVKVLVPSAKSGIISGIILATGTAVGEAIAVAMVGGGISKIPDFLSHGFVSLLTPVLTLAAAIINKSETMSVESASSVLFACGLLLLVSCTVLNVLSRTVEYVIRKRLGYD